MKKYIKTVTVTGASDETTYQQMADIQARFPFVEWAILYSQKMAGQSNRFPTMEWIRGLMEFTKTTPLNLSLHLCGRVVNVFLNQKCSGSAFLSDPSAWITYFLEQGHMPFKRIQINTHGEKHKYDLDAIESYLKFAPHVEFIAQYDEVNDYIHKLKENGHTNISALYDLSHGAGVLPEGWDKPLEGIFTGYAGGLSPDNLEEQLTKLDAVVSEPIWIDAETWLRTDDFFDLDKVVKFLEVAESRVIV